jgi:hypothetical protein
VPADAGGSLKPAGAALDGAVAPLVLAPAGIGAGRSLGRAVGVVEGEGCSLASADAGGVIGSAGAGVDGGERSLVPVSAALAARRSRTSAVAAIEGNLCSLVPADAGVLIRSADAMIGDAATRVDGSLAPVVAAGEDAGV